MVWAGKEGEKGVMMEVHGRDAERKKKFFFSRTSPACYVHTRDGAARAGVGGEAFPPEKFVKDDSFRQKWPPSPS